MRNSTIRVELPLLKILGAGGRVGLVLWISSDGGKNQNPKKSLGLPTNPPPPPHSKETMDQKLTPRNSHSKFLSLIKWFYETDAMYYVKY